MHPTTSQLIDYVDDRLGLAMRRGVSRHLMRDCGRCQKRVGLYRMLLDALRRGPLSSAPRPLVEAAIGFFRSVPSVEESNRESGSAGQGGASHLIGTLVYDSWNAAASGMRAHEQHRRLRFEGGGVELDLVLQPRAEGWHIRGQALHLATEPAPLASAHWRIVASGETLGEGDCDGFGAFAVSVATREPIEIVLEPGPFVVRFPLPG